MRILYISSQIFKKSSSASIRNISLLNGLAKKKINIDVLTIEYPNHYEDEYFKKIIDKDIKVYKAPLKMLNYYLENKRVSSTIDDTKKKSSLKKLKVKEFLKDLYFFPDVDKEWIHNYNNLIFENKYDLIISSSDTKTSHFVAKKIISRMSYQVKWFQIWGDPWADDINLKKHQKLRASYNEKKLLEEADKAFYVSNPTLMSMKKKYRDMEKKLSFIPRSFLKEVYGNEKGSTNLWEFSYTGSLNSNRNIYPLLEKIEEFNLKNKKEIRFNIYGNVNGNIKNELSKYKFVKLYGQINFEEIIEVYKKSDVLVFIDNGVGTTQIPGKLFDYFGTDRGILSLISNLDSELGTFIKESNRSYLFENKFEKIDLNFLYNTIKHYPLETYSNLQVAEKLLKEGDFE